MADNKVESSKQPLLSARQVGVAAAFGGAALALVLAGVTIPIPGTPVVTDPRRDLHHDRRIAYRPYRRRGRRSAGRHRRARHSARQPAGARSWRRIQWFVYKNFSWRFKDNKVLSLAAWALQICFITRYSLSQCSWLV